MTTRSLLTMITEHADATGVSMTELADRIGVTRGTVYRWSKSMPGPETLRRVADELGEPYPTVLAAALSAGGYIDEPDDLLAGTEIHVITHGFSYYEEWPTPVAAYTRKADADKLIDDTEWAGAYESHAVRIEKGVQLKPAERFFAAFDRDRPSRDAVAVHGGAVVPFGFPDLSDAELIETGGIDRPFLLMLNGYLMRAEVSGFHEGTVRTAVERIVQLLSDRIPPRGTPWGAAELPPMSGPLPQAIMEGEGNFNGIPWHTACVADLLTEQERAIAAEAYRTARVVNAEASQVLEGFDAAATRGN